MTSDLLNQDCHKVTSRQTSSTDVELKERQFTIFKPLTDLVAKGADKLYRALFSDVDCV